MAKKWVTAEFSLDPLLEPIYPILNTVDGVLSALITILNIVQKILNVIKAFLFGLLDPLRALVELIIAEIRAIIQDLRQIGFYLAGDWALIDGANNHKYLLGGYAAYEQRMLSRLLDTTDPNRPNFSSSSAALGIFLYASSGDISDIIRLAKAIMKLFGRDDLLAKAGPYPTPTSPTILYGSFGVQAFSKLSEAFEGGQPDQISVSWSMPTGTSKSPFKNPAPKGFLLHVSTLPDGLEVVASTSNPSSPKPNEPLRILGGAVDPITNAPLKLYGGVADLGVDTTAKNYDSVEGSSPQAPLLFLKKDQLTPLIKPSTLVRSSGPPLLGNTYYIKMSDLSPQRIGGGTQFTATLNLRDLPLSASFRVGDDGFAELDGEPVPSDSFTVRVRALTSNYTNFAQTKGLSGSLSSPSSVFDSDLRVFQISNSGIKGAATKNGVILPDATGYPGTSEAIVSFKDVTSASGPGVVSVPSENLKNYYKALQTALALAILCRCDLTEYSEGNFKNTYAPGYALTFETEARSALGALGIDGTFYKDMRPQVFRQKIRNLLLKIVPNNPPESTIAALLDQVGDLLDFTWDKIDPGYPRLTILESLGIGGDPLETEGVGANPFCRTIPKEILSNKYALLVSSGNSAGPERSPSFVPPPKGIGGQWLSGGGSADESPILYQDLSPASTKTRFIRNAVYEYQDKILLSQSRIVLGLALCEFSTPATDGGWLAIRLMPQALTPLDQLLTKVDRFLQGVLDGLQGIIDQIIKYIEAIQARIYQLQALLELIRSLLRSLSLIQLPSVSALVLVESGTAGLVTGLLTSENKPQDDSSDYGFGVLGVTGGIPTVFFEILALLFKGG